RLLHALPVGTLVQLRPRIVDAVADHRPAVVGAALDDVDLIPAARAVLDDPEDAGCRVDGSRLGVAVAPAPDLGPRVWLPDERVVGGHAAVGLDANDLAPVSPKILCETHLITLPECHEELAVRREGEA